MTSAPATASAPTTDEVTGAPRGPRATRGPRGTGRFASWWTHAVLAVAAAAWLTPVGWALYTSLRPKAATDAHGYFSIGGSYGWGNYQDAWAQGGFARAFTNSVLITVPAVVVALLLSSMLAFAISQFPWRYSVAALVVFTASNMLPPQVLAAPLFAMFKNLTLPYALSDSGSLLNTYVGVTAVDIAFQLGFCTFVLSNYMKALPRELIEAAHIDGCGVVRMYAQIVLPLCRPAIAALAVLQTAWIYNDFFWPLLFIQSGDRLPVTTSINSLQGLFLRDNNLIAAGAVIALVPTLVVYLMLQRQFVAGLTLGATKS